MSNILPFSHWGWSFILLYLLSLILVGYIAKKSRVSDSLEDYYLAGRNFGPIVLILTLYATQYSGNSIFGVSGNAYRLGYTWLVGVHYMLAIVMGYLLFAGKLHKLSKAHQFLTPSDYLFYRFRSKRLCTLASMIMIICLSNYFLAQLMTMGRAFQGLAGDYGDIAYDYGVIMLALIMVIYGTLGGIRAIAWTDMIQGLVLMSGLIFLIILVRYHFGPLEQVNDIIYERSGEVFLDPPKAPMLREWMSYMIVIGLGGALYPHAMQRIFAAKNIKTLYKSLSVMSFMPYTTALIALIAGLYALAYIPGLEGSNADQALAGLLRLIQETSIFGGILVVIIFAAFLAALMSTADSAMLTISSMFTKDIFAQRSGGHDQSNVNFGKRLSWVLVSMLVLLAILMKDHASLIAVMDRKFDLLVQLVPAFIISLHYKFLSAKPVFYGLLFGVLISLVLAFVPFSFIENGKFYGFHPGVVALPINILIATIGSLKSGLKPFKYT